MFRIYGRDGKLSFLRLGILGALIGILVIVAGLILFFIDRASHQVPLDIDPYPGAQRLDGQLTRANNIRSIYFHISGASADDVAAYYQQKLDQFYGNNSNDQSRETCVRNPRFENFPEFDEGVEGVVPYEYRCVFDRSGLNISQYTQVTIQPGIEATGTEGLVVVEYTQYWQP